MGLQKTKAQGPGNSGPELRQSASSAPVTLNLADGLSVLKKMISIKDVAKRDPFVVAIAGGSASGKTSMVALKIHEEFKDRSVLIPMDHYYKGVKYIEAERSKGRDVNLDHPDAVDLKLLSDHIRQLKAGQPINRPVYSFKTAEREGSETVEPRKIIIIEGLFALNGALADDRSIGVFVDAGAHGRIIRRLLRDTGRTGWKPIKTMKYFMKITEPMYRLHVEPTRDDADIVINNEYAPSSEASRSGMREMQLKYRIAVDDEALRRMGAERLASTRQIDDYYNAESADFGLTGEIFRVRNEGSSTMLTYKGPTVSSFAVDRPRFEFEIDPEVADALSSVYKKTSRVEKTRTLYRYKGLVFSIDTDVMNGSVGLGNFLEVRFRMDGSDGDAAKELLGKLDIDESKAVRKSYYMIGS